MRRTIVNALISGSLASGAFLVFCVPTASAQGRYYYPAQGPANRSLNAPTPAPSNYYYRANTPVPRASAPVARSSAPAPSAPQARRNRLGIPRPVRSVPKPGSDDLYAYKS